ncbi:MAG: SCO family protein [Schleiferiaceae bacterium]|nr:SCO family protein [Schleiferiaceae bacterium]
MTSKRLLLGVLLVLPVAMYLGSLVISGAVNFRTLEDLGDPLEKAAWSDSIQFTQSDLQNWTPDSLEGKIAVVSFFFTSCPTICPAMNFHLKEAHDRLYGFKDLIFISCTVDPQTDVPVVLEAYKERLGVDGSNKWSFITGQREDLYALANSYYLVAMQDSSAEGGYSHSQSAVILDWNGHVRSRITDEGNLLGIYDVSEPYLVDQLVDDVRVLVKEHRKIKMGQ